MSAKIRIIDDDADIGNLEQEVLERAGYAVLRAYSGTEALLLLKDTPPDLILLDLMLPGLSGEEVLPRLRGIPVIVVSARAAKGIEWELELPRQTYYGSEALLEQVWVNVLDNAVKHSPAGGGIAVELSRSDGGLAVCITDHGDGMTEEVQKHMFEKLYQGDSSRKAEGSGLGLALVKRIIELCRGSIAVESAPGRGTAFTVRLPL